MSTTTKKKNLCFCSFASCWRGDVSLCGAFVSDRLQSVSAQTLRFAGPTTGTPRGTHCRVLFDDARAGTPPDLAGYSPNCLPHARLLTHCWRRRPRAPLGQRIDSSAPRSHCQRRLVRQPFLTTTTTGEREKSQNFCSRFSGLTDHRSSRDVVRFLTAARRAPTKSYLSHRTV
jgi:hypothetical protein